MKAALKIVGTCLLVAIGFVLGYLLTGLWYERMVMPALIKRYPHDGQIGLSAFVAAIGGGVVGALVGFFAGMFLAFRQWNRSPVTEQNG